MTTVKFLSIIILFSLDIHIVKANKLTLMKCCNLGEYFSKHTCNTTDLSHNFNITDLKLYSESLSLTGRSLKHVYELEPGDKNRIKEFFDLNLQPYLTETGILYLEAPNEYVRWIKFGLDEFCVDYRSDKKKKLTPHFWVLDSPPSGETMSKTYKIAGLLASCVFLALVLVVYSLIPELRNLNGLVLMAYVASLFSAFLLLATVLTGTEIDSLNLTECKLLTYFCYFCLLASFCWMNVMSYDIWWTFRGFAKARPIHRFGEWYKFKVYCAYAFGVPLAMAVFLVTVDQVPMRHLPWFITPHVGQKACFLGDEILLYLYTPMMILILMNWLFFIMTSCDIWSLHRQTAILDTATAGKRAAHRRHRTRLLVYLKLSVIMGVNWILEVISDFSPTLKIWYITDAYNFLIGISIFFIFVCKRKILRKLKNRYRTWRGLDPADIGNKSHSSYNTNSNLSEEVPLQVCPHADASFKHKTYERRFEFK